MNEPHDSNETIDASAGAADSLDAGLAAGFGRRVDGPTSVLSALGSTLGSLQPVLRLLQKGRRTRPQVRQSAQ